jgi:hypothetical protein
MTAIRYAYVDCVKDGLVIASYTFGIPCTLGPSLSPSGDTLILEAKTNLSNDMKAMPPYDGITFRVRWP